jgi:phospho-N-acetylmuramoyl-pentapeptide-transferase
VTLPIDLFFAGPLIGTALFVIWANLMISGMSNGVNLTDGLDGLATGASTMVFAAYVLIGIWENNQNCASTLSLKCYDVRDPLDLAVVAAAAMGACFGFLWWNASPAKIFMGDTGSLALGGALAGLAITTRTQLLVVILGGLFVVITMSVVIQVASFKSTGKRVFRMAPLQHHFELLGWQEVTIVIRFWIIAGLFVALGLGIFYAEWVVGGIK